MKREPKTAGIVLIAAVVVIAVITAPGIAFAQGPADVEITHISGKMYKVVCTANFTSNCLVVKGKDGLLLVDTGLQQTADLLVEKLTALDAGPVRYILHTHAHQDHTGANALLGGDAVVIAHDNFARSYKTGFGLLTELPEEAYPDVTFIKTHMLEFDGEMIEMIHFRGGHSDGDAVVLFKDSGVMCVGGLVAADQFPYLDLRGGGDILQYSKILFKIMSMYPDVTRFVPSHGRDYKRWEMSGYRDMIKATTAAVENGLDEGKNAEALQAEDVLAEWDSWDGGFVNKDAWIRTVAASLTGDVPRTGKVVFEPLYYTVRRENAAAAIEQYYELKKMYGNIYDFGEANLNALGYYLMGKERYDEAIEVLALNIELFRESANVYDSMGEAYMLSGDGQRAIEYYRKALEIDPEMPSALSALSQLKAE